jgi:hypothetical protein
MGAALYTPASTEAICRRTRVSLGGPCMNERSVCGCVGALYLDALASVGKAADARSGVRLSGLDVADAREQRSLIPPLQRHYTHPRQIWPRPGVSSVEGWEPAGCTVLDVRQAPHVAQELVRAVGEVVGHAQAQAVKRAREHALLGLALVVHRARHQLGWRSTKHLAFDD